MLVKIFNTNQSTQEWCLLEFQGEIVGDMVGEFGQIELKNGIAYMEIGQHTLEGEVLKLKSAFLVVEKKPTDDANLNANPSLTIYGLVRQKIIFKQRPRPKALTK